MIHLLADRYGHVAIDDQPTCLNHASNIGGWSHTCVKTHHIDGLHVCSCGWLW